MKRLVAFSLVPLFALACSATVPDGETAVSEDELVARACDGKSCGATCSVCNGRPGCVETAVVKACNALGRCTASAPRCAAPYEPCAGKTCGDSCSACAPSDPNCVETAVLKQCDAAGACNAGNAVCKPAYDPCGGKACGASCSICPPGDPNCVETAVVKQCDASGICSASPSGC